MNELRFKRVDSLEHDVDEIIYDQPIVPCDDGTFSRVGRTQKFWAGQLRFNTGMNEGWWFVSSDSSVRWNLGTNLKKAQAELRRRYAEGQRKGKEGDRRRARARQRNKDGSRPRIRARRRSARRLP